MTISDISTKADLLNHLASLWMAAIYDIFAQTCLHQFIKNWSTGTADPDSLTTELPEGTVTFRKFMDQLAAMGNCAQLETKRNANRALTRNFLKEVFRITQSFCKKTDQANKMAAEHWYQFTRILVNSLSHNFRLDYRPHDKSQLPVTYKNETLDISMDRKPVSMQLSILLSLTDEIINFAKNRLD